MFMPEMAAFVQRVREISGLEKELETGAMTRLESGRGTTAVRAPGVQ
jgi:hypothetical protein